MKLYLVLTWFARNTNFVSRKVSNRASHSHPNLVFTIVCLKHPQLSLFLKVGTLESDSASSLFYASPFRGDGWRVVLCQFSHFSILVNQDSFRVASIGRDQFVALDEQDTGRTAWFGRIWHTLLHLRLYCTKRVTHLTLYWIECLSALSWESLLNLKVHGVLYKAGRVSSMWTVAIANAKHVHALTFLHVWREDKCILVDLICDTRFKANSCSESKLFDHVLLLYVC